MARTLSLHFESALQKASSAHVEGKLATWRWHAQQMLKASSVDTKNADSLKKRRQPGFPKLIKGCPNWDSLSFWLGNAWEEDQLVFGCLSCHFAALGSNSQR